MSRFKFITVALFWNLIAGFFSLLSASQAQTPGTVIAVSSGNTPAGTNQYDSAIWAAGRVENITSWSELGGLFTSLQGAKVFAYGVAGALVAVAIAFLLHYLVIGPKRFSHDGNKILAFSLLERVAHFVAAISWIILVPTGIIMLFGADLGGGAPIRLAKNAHGIATVIFAISLPPLLVIWFWRMLPRFYDLRWLLMVGGYLSKQKREIPAGKFNAGQKMWYYVAFFGGLVMIATGAAMYFLDFAYPAKYFGLAQIDLLRLSAIIHSTLGVLCAVFFAVHIYMAAIAIKGAIHSMITGYKEEEEVYYLHHYWYEELVEKGKIKPFTPKNSSH